MVDRLPFVGLENYANLIKTYTLVSTGVDTYEIELNYDIEDGQEISVKIPFANSGSTTFTNVSGIGPSGAKDVVTTAGVAFEGMLEARTHRFMWDNSNDRWIVLDPAGGVVEKGSNANGVYIRWGNGEQLCYIESLEVQETTGNRFEATWTFPAAFNTDPPYVSVSPSMASTGGDSWSGGITTLRNLSVAGPNTGASTSSCTLRVWAAAGFTVPTDETGTVKASAWGTWK